MIDLENYKRAIAWLRRGMLEIERAPDNSDVQLSILHRFEVTHNVTDAILREAYADLDVDDMAATLSLRELIRRAAEDGLRLSTVSQWLHYAVLLESTKEAWMETLALNLGQILPILPQYAAELDAFAASLTRKLAPRV